MAREPRVHEEGLIVHWMFRGNGGQNIFDNERFARRFLYFLAQYAPKFDCCVLGFCLMGNHGHMLTQSGKIPLWDLTELLLGRYARYVNYMRGTRGHVLEDRYQPVVVKNDAQLLNTLRYIHRNPVEAGFCESPEEWAFSSNLAYLGRPDGITTTEPIMRFLSSKDPLGAYRRFMNSPAPCRLSYEDELWKEVPNILSELPASEKPRVPKPLLDLADILAKRAGTSLEGLRRYRRTEQGRKLRRQVLLAALEAGFSQADVARLLECSRSAISQQMQNVET